MSSESGGRITGFPGREWGFPARRLRVRQVYGFPQDERAAADTSEDACREVIRPACTKLTIDRISGLNC